MHGRTDVKRYAPEASTGLRRRLRECGRRDQLSSADRRPSAREDFAARAWSLDKAYALPYALSMKTITATEARKTLYRLLDEVAVTSEPVQISGRRSSGVLVSEDDWRAIEETLHLLSIPGMRESIQEGLATPIEECVEELDW